jgi:hypothetical protein
MWQHSLAVDAFGGAVDGTTHRNGARLGLVIAVPLATLLSDSGWAGAAQGKHAMKVAVGTFEVKMAPKGEPQTADGLTLNRFINEKRFAGDLIATSRGEMLTATTPVENSAGYVLIERVTGTLQGRRGSFVLQHSSTVARGAQRQSIVVVPDSGAGDLMGLSGEMTVKVSLGQHAYTFRYSLPE